MDDNKLRNLSRRERQIMDAVYSFEEATVAEIREQMPDPPTINAVRRMISILEEKGYLKHRWQGPRHVYYPVIDKDRARESAIEHLKQTFFEGSATQAMATLLDYSKSELSRDELDTLAALIEQAKKENR